MKTARIVITVETPAETITRKTRTYAPRKKPASRPNPQRYAQEGSPSQQAYAKSQAIIRLRALHTKYCSLFADPKDGQGRARAMLSMRVAAGSIENYTLEQLNKAVHLLRGHVEQKIINDCYLA